MTYIEFINNIIVNRGRFGIPKDEYKERHHILPRSLGGTSKSENLVDLYAREHFIAHQLLYNENQNVPQIAYAYWMMAICKSDNQERHECTPEEYERAKIACAKIQSECSKKYWENEEHRKKLCEASKGSSNPNARKVIRLIDETIYDCLDYAAASNNMHRDTVLKRCHAYNGFMYYDEYLNLKDNDIDLLNKYIDDSYCDEIKGCRINCRGQKVIRLIDLTIYDSLQESADKNNTSYGVMNRRCLKNKDFMYYNTYMYMKEFCPDILNKYIEQSSQCFCKSLSKEYHQNARKIIKLLDFTIYGYAKEACDDNHMSHPTLIKRCKERNGFMYYDEYVELQNKDSDLLNYYICVSNYEDGRGKSPNSHKYKTKQNDLNINLC